MNQQKTAIYMAHISLAILVFISLSPIALVVLNAFKDSASVSASPFSLPKSFNFQNFSDVWNYPFFLKSLLNSSILVFFTVIIVIICATPAAWVLARKSFNGWKVVTVWFMACMTFPVQLYLFAIYFVFSQLGLTNNLFWLSVIYAAAQLPFSIFILRAYFINLSIEIEEAATIDGATKWKCFVHILVPLVSPGLITIALMVGLAVWNEFLMASIFLQDQENYNSILMFYSMRGTFSVNWGQQMAASLMLLAPVIALFIILQRFFIAGISGGSTKG